jgi:hypothetical protein
MTSKVITIAVLGIACVVKLLVTGVCLAIGFRVGNILCLETEKRIAQAKVKTA